MFWIFLLVFFVFPHFFFVFRPSSFILRSSSSFIFHYLDQRLQPNIVVLRHTTLVSNCRCHHKQFTILQNLMTHLSGTILAESPNYSDRFLEAITRTRHKVVYFILYKEYKKYCSSSSSLPRVGPNHAHSTTLRWHSPSTTQRDTYVLHTRDVPLYYLISN